MHRVDSANHVSNMFSDGPPGTVIEEDWLNAVQEEIVATVLASGASLVKGTNTQLRDAVIALLTTIARSYTTATANATPVTGTGNGTGSGLRGVGGTTSGAGVSGQGGAPNGVGGTFAADGSGAGVVAVGGDSAGTGVFGTGGATDGNGVRGLANTNGIGVLGEAASASGYGVHAQGDSTGYGLKVSSSTSDQKVVDAHGYIDLGSGGSPADNAAAMQHTLTKNNMTKAWIEFTTDGAGGHTVVAGYNIHNTTPITITSTPDGIEFQVRTAMPSTVVGVFAQDYSATPYHCHVVAGDAVGGALDSKVFLTFYDLAGGAVDPGATAVKARIAILGAA